MFLRRDDDVLWDLRRQENGLELDVCSNHFCLVARRLQLLLEIGDLHLVFLFPFLVLRVSERNQLYRNFT